MKYMGDVNVQFLTRFDANNDGQMDLVVASENDNGDLIIYEVPTSKAFTWVYAKRWKD